MLAELAKTITDDGVRLDGALHAPEAPTSDTSKTAAILLHGVSSNFYSSSLMEAVASVLVHNGVAALRANTRGHDIVTLAWIEGRARWDGSAFETVSKCAHDIPSWMGFLSDRGYEKIFLVGHSLGAIKSVYTVCHAPDCRPQGIVAMSPPRLSYQAFMEGPDQPLFFEAMDQAQQAVQKAQFTSLLRVRFPFPLLISASSYVDKYGPDENYNLLRFANRLHCPTLFTYGELELRDGGIAFAGVPEALAGLEYDHDRPEFATVDGAHYMYSDRYDEISQRVVDWLLRNA